ncbi:MAG TPA: M15 family metallopeptidase [Aestuariivirgaceae bacterium]|nr:M15 family metallopeptidase [Aestuariivirgaceae bacterium]
MTMLSESAASPTEQGHKLHSRRRLHEAAAAAASSDSFEEIAEVEGLIIDMRYASKNNFMSINLYGPFNKLYLHKIAAKKLRRAAVILKKSHPRYDLLVFDGLRPHSVQRVLWNKVKGTPQQTFVANPKTGSIHNYGFAVDLTLADNGQELDMGTPFDDFRPLAQPVLEAKFLAEGKLKAQQVANRKLLRRVMTKAGFQQLAIEWWHFDALPQEQAKKHPIFE